MGQSTTGTATFTPCAALAALGCHLQRIDLFAPIREQVRIAQKTVAHTPADKLYDAFIAVLAGAHGLAEVNTRRRSDPALQQAFGRRACADHSTVQATLTPARPRTSPSWPRRSPRSTADTAGVTATTTAGARSCWAWT